MHVWESLSLAAENIARVALITFFDIILNIFLVLKISFISFGKSLNFLAFTAEYLFSLTHPCGNQFFKTCFSRGVVISPQPTHLSLGIEVSNAQGSVVTVVEIHSEAGEFQ